MDQITAADLHNVDALIHVASVGVSPQQATWTEVFYWNVTVLIQLLMEAKKASVKRVVIAGSSAEYGLSADRYDFIPADAPLFPTTHYAASKAAGYIAASAFAAEQNIEIVYLRIFSAYGPGQYEKNFFPALKQAAISGTDFAMTKGEQIRDFIPVETVAQALLHGAERTDVQAGVCRVENLASGQPQTMLEFATHWWELWHAKGNLLPGLIPYRPNEPMRFAAQVEKRH